EVMNDLRMPQKRGTWAKWDKRCGATRTTSPRWGEAQAAFGRRSWHEGRRCEASAMALLRAGEGASMHRISARLPPHPDPLPKGERECAERASMSVAQSRRIGFAAALAMLALGAPAHAQENWPQRQVTVVVPFSAGGSADLIGRIVAQHLQAKFGAPFVVENRGGAGGSIGAAYVAKAPNDGDTLFIGTASTNPINPHPYQLPLDAA